MGKLVNLRLLKAYRTYGVGSVIYATPGLAEHLVANGTALRDLQESLQEEAGRQTAERAVAGNQAAETR